MESKIKSFEQVMIEEFGEDYAEHFDNNLLCVASFCYENGKAEALKYVMKGINSKEGEE